MTSDGRSTGPILLVGADGQLGTALAPRLARLGALVRATRADADLERPDDIRNLVRRVRPRLVVNAAGYTAVDDAEGDEARCARLNTIAPTVLAEESARMGVPFIHYSTNYVFDGDQGAPYSETETMSPLGVYGATKAEGERGVIGANPRHVILRTAALYGHAGRNFMLRVLELAREREELRVVDDQFISPTPAWLVADATVTVISQLFTERADTCGVFHLTTTGAVSWHEFARRILALDPQAGSQRAKTVVAIGTNEYPTPARRPPNGVLSVERFERTFGHRLPPWDDALRRTLQDPGACA